MLFDGGELFSLSVEVENLFFVIELTELGVDDVIMKKEVFLPEAVVKEFVVEALEERVMETQAITLHLVIDVFGNAPLIGERLSLVISSVDLDGDNVAVIDKAAQQFALFLIKRSLGLGGGLGRGCGRGSGRNRRCGLHRDTTFFGTELVHVSFFGNGIVLGPEFRFADVEHGGALADVNAACDVVRDDGDGL